MRTVLLGTGTPAPSLARQGAGCLIEVGGDVLVFDHGPGAHHRLLESGRRATDVTHAFFSHLHYDHWLDYPRLVLQRWDQGAGRIPDLDVYGPAPLAQVSDRLFGADGACGPDIAARVGHESSLDVYRARGGTPPRQPPAPRVREVRAGDVVAGPTWTVRVGRAAHVQPYLECLSFRLDAPDGSICYAGDSAACDALAELAAGCDVLIQMNHFLDGRQPSAASRDACGNHRANAELARRAGVGTLVLTHLPPDIDTPALRDAMLADMRAIFGGRIVWGEDLLELTTGRG